MIVKLKKLSNNFKMPERKSEYASGFDLASIEEFTLGPGEKLLVHCGFSMEIPPGYEGQIRPRSGLAIKKGLTVINSPGTVDADYRGEVMVGLINHGRFPAEIKVGDRIAQLVICEVPEVELVEASELSETDRGSSGFGSTGDK